MAKNWRGKSYDTDWYEIDAFGNRTSDQKDWQANREWDAANDPAGAWNFSPEIAKANPVAWDTTPRGRANWAAIAAGARATPTTWMQPPGMTPPSSMPGPGIPPGWGRGGPGPLPEPRDPSVMPLPGPKRWPPEEPGNGFEWPPRYGFGEGESWLSGGAILQTLADVLARNGPGDILPGPVKPGPPRLPPKEPPYYFPGPNQPGGNANLPVPPSMGGPSRKTSRRNRIRTRRAVLGTPEY